MSFRSNRREHDKQPDDFVQVHYLYSAAEEGLPTSFFDDSIRYRFRLVRDPSCVTDMPYLHSEKFSGTSAYISPARGAPEPSGFRNTLWDSHLPLDCYLFERKYKIQK